MKLPFHKVLQKTQAGLSTVIDWLFKYFSYKINRKYMEVLSTKEYAIILLDRGFMWIKF